MNTAVIRDLAIGTVVLAGLFGATAAHAGKTLDQIRERGQLVCGVNTGLAGFSQADSMGHWSGLDVVGSKSALNLPRGINNLWNYGGLMYAPPIR
jgi:hypothetical protein